MKSTEHSSNRSDDDDGYEADDEGSECSRIPSPPKVAPPDVTFTFSKPEVPVTLLKSDGQHISTGPNNNNNTAIFDQERGEKRKLDENGSNTPTPKQQKRYHVHGGHIMGVKREVQGQYSVEDFKRLKLSPEEDSETRSHENMHLLSNSLSGTERGNDLNITYSAASFVSSVSLPTSSDGNAPYKNTKTENADKNNISENEATSCPSRCQCNAIVSSFVRYLREEANCKVYDTHDAVSRECDHPKCEARSQKGSELTMSDSSSSSVASVSLPAISVNSVDLSAPVNLIPEPIVSTFVQYLREQAKCKVFDAFTRKSDNLEEWVYISVEPQQTFDILPC
ncbi:uncharacterized protein LOC123534577 [Mercenaria mercenaria]|uniref:uncharacterized protein LOC123534577 n=1 Tax=Mercenaria mercenaria TaxID=6596 RepID=UPI00234F0EEB|nr:uncharacterized protein LOC123534577 [Mercenaria mercenaria]